MTKVGVLAKVWSKIPRAQQNALLDALGQRHRERRRPNRGIQRVLAPAPLGPVVGPLAPPSIAFLIVVGNVERLRAAEVLARLYPSSR